MRNLLRLIITYNFFIVFLIFEFISVSLTINNSRSKLGVFMSSANSLSGFFQEKTTGISKYFNLRKDNRLLIKENQSLNNKIAYYGNIVESESERVNDESFTYMTAEVVKNSVFNTYNILTINKGSEDGVAPDMAIVSSAGIVGITAKTGKHYTTVVSVLNSKLGISAKLKKSDFFGSVSWDADDYRYVYLTEIPDHALVKKGDTVVTSGFSSILPKNIIIGFVEKIEKVSENNFFKIKVKLSQDFKSLRYVYIIDIKNKTEKDSLENETKEQFQF
jgi:rod shape-determining protein MreC